MSGSTRWHFRSYNGTTNEGDHQTIRFSGDLRSSSSSYTTSLEIRVSGAIWGEDYYFASNAQFLRHSGGYDYFRLPVSRTGNTETAVRLYTNDVPSDKHISIDIDRVNLSDGSSGTTNYPDHASITINDSDSTQPIGVDLALSQVSIVLDTVTEEQQFEVRTQLDNLGDARASAASVRFDLYSDASYSNLIDSKVRDVGRLNEGGQTWVNQHFSLQDGSNYQNVYVRATALNYNSADQYTSNNTGTDSAGVNRPPEPDQPDLVIRNVSPLPDEFRAGDTISPAFSVENIGVADASTSQVALHLINVSTNQTVETYLVDTTSLRGTNHYTGHVRIFDGNDAQIVLPDDLPPGDYRISIQADGGNGGYGVLNEESDANNYYLTETFVVSASRDPVANDDSIAFQRSVDGRYFVSDARLLANDEAGDFGKTINNFSQGGANGNDTSDGTVTYDSAAGGYWFAVNDVAQNTAQFSYAIDNGSGGGSWASVNLSFSGDVPGNNDDHGNAALTAGAVAVGGATSGNIESANDQDWFAVTFLAGQDYQINLEGTPTNMGTLTDTYLYGIYDSNSNLISNTSNDDGGTYLNSQIDFTAGSSGIYYISAGAFSANTGTYTLSVNGLNGVNNVPAITSPTSIAINENATAVLTVEATDQDGDALTFTVSGGADAGLFQINANSGALSFRNAPDFETPASDAGSNVYQVEVTASDGNGGSNAQTIAVTVNDVDDTEILQSTVDIFAAEGQLRFMAMLAKAAYHLDLSGGHEFVREDFNEISPNAVDHYLGNNDLGLVGIRNVLHLFTADDLPTLALETDDRGDTGNFPLQGLANGIFTHGNAAALVGRSADAIFVSFRGTNDNSEGNLFLDRAPDVDDWFNLGRHNGLFNELKSAILDYTLNESNGITKIYVTGHSLGGGMTQAYMLENENNSLFEAVTFASSGYINPASDQSDDRMINFWNDDDIINIADIGSNYLGDQNIITNGVTGGSTAEHSMDLYYGIINELHNAGVNIADLNVSSTGIDYDDVIIETDLVDINTGTFSFAEGADTLTGTSAHEIIIGGRGNDILSGGGGIDMLFGGADNDTIYFDILDDLDNVLGGTGTDTLVFTTGSAPTYFDLAAHEFEVAHQELTDTSSASWTTITNVYDVNWQLVGETTVSDDGTSAQTSHELGGETWNASTFSFDSAGAQTQRYITYDAGSALRYGYDTTGAGIGQQDWLQEFSDLGGTLTRYTDFDQDGDQVWTSTYNLYDGGGVRTQQFISYDDATSARYGYAANGGTDWLQENHDNGVLARNTDYDQAGNQTFIEFYDLYDTAGVQTQKFVTYDNGTSSRFGYDGAGLTDWLQEYRADGTLQYYTDFDQAGTATWEHFVNTYDVDGTTLLSRHFFNDDGTDFIL